MNAYTRRMPVSAGETVETHAYLVYLTCWTNITS